MEPEQGLDAFDGARHRVQSALPSCPTRQADVERFGFKLCRQFGFGELLTALIQRRLDGLLGLIDLGTPCLLLLDGEGRQALHQLRHAPTLADETRLGVLQVGGRGGLRERAASLVNQFKQTRHGNQQKKGRPSTGRCSAFARRPAA
jgi:hypothetical protein